MKLKRYIKRKSGVDELLMELEAYKLGEENTKL